MGEDSTDQQLAAFVARLDGATRAGRVRWELAEAGRDDAFTVATPSGAVTLLTRDNDGREPFVLMVRDARGRLVERADLRWASDEDAELYALVARLYRVARHQALGTHAVIDALLRDLEE